MRPMIPTGDHWTRIRMIFDLIICGVSHLCRPGTGRLRVATIAAPPKERSTNCDGVGGADTSASAPRLRCGVAGCCPLGRDEEAAVPITPKEGCILN